MSEILAGTIAGAALALGVASAQAALSQAGSIVRVDIGEGGLPVHPVVLQAGVPVTLVLRNVAEEPGEVVAPALGRSARLANGSRWLRLPLGTLDSAAVTLTPDRPGSLDLVLLGFQYLPISGAPSIMRIQVIG